MAVAGPVSWADDARADAICDDDDDDDDDDGTAKLVDGRLALDSLPPPPSSGKGTCP